jgi:uncharacterized protein
MPSETASRLQQDVIATMKSRDKVRLGVLRQLQAAIKQVEVDERRELDESGVLKVLQSYAKKVRDSLSSAEQAGRDDLQQAARFELDLVESYLPAAMSDDELAALVDAVIAELGATGLQQMGQVMQAVMPRVAGRAEGGRVSAVVKSRLAG